MEFLGILFLHAHYEAEEHVKYILGMNGMAAQPKISDGYFKSKRSTFLLESLMPSSARMV